MSFWTADRNRAAAKYSDRVKILVENIEGERKTLVSHPVYTRVRSLDELYIFMQHHVFAVWDFMSLLKSLQRTLSCVEVPWTPLGDPYLRRLVNDIVLSEETDEDGTGGYGSHFELYLGAMRQVGADTGAIDDFVKRIERKESVSDALIRCGAPVGALRFVQTSFDVIDSKELHRIAAYFTFGREDVVPDMFRNIVMEMRKSNSMQLDRFVYYLDRHIAVDTDVHGPMAFAMIDRICGDSHVKWQEAEEAAVAAIRSRVKLWDTVAAMIQERRSSTIVQIDNRRDRSSTLVQLMNSRRDRNSKVSQMIDNLLDHSTRRSSSYHTMGNAAE
jgi:hypothetical protein